MCCVICMAWGDELYIGCVFIVYIFIIIYIIIKILSGVDEMVGVDAPFLFVQLFVVRIIGHQMAVFTVGWPVLFHAGVFISNEIFFHT